MDKNGSQNNNQDCEEPNLKIQKAIISVSDKGHLEWFSRALSHHGVDFYCTKGTQDFLISKKLNPLSTDLLNTKGESLDGLIKTISFEIMAALLYDRNNREHINLAENSKIPKIDLVICNLYPFSQTLKTVKDRLANIDIGGVALIRAAAKNFNHVTIVVDPSDYQSVIDELVRNNGSISYDLRKRLMIKAFNYVADYDSLIAVSMSELNGENRFRCSGIECDTLRYGENPKQKAISYKIDSLSLSFADQYADLNHKIEKIENTYSSEDLKSDFKSWSQKIIYGQKLISYNNILDLWSGKELLGTLIKQHLEHEKHENNDLNKYHTVIIKHNNPCGVASSSEPFASLKMAIDSDKVSSYGGILMTNIELGLSEYHFLSEFYFDIIVTTKMRSDLEYYLRTVPHKHKNLRIIIDEISGPTQFHPELNIDGKLFNGQNFLLQLMNEQSRFEHTDPLIQFGLCIAYSLKSNAIAIVGKDYKNNFHLLAHAQGFTDRFSAVKSAIENYKKHHSANLEISSVTLISDGFFPFIDSIEYIASENIPRCVAPSGSIRDSEIKNKTVELKLNFEFIPYRLFKH